MVCSKGLCLINDANFCRLSNILVKLYRFYALRPVIIYTVLHVENGEYFSGTLRKILFKYHGVRAGEYTYGSCMSPGSWPAGVSIGRYCSVGSNVKVYLRNHPMERLSMHPFFYNKALGYLDSDNIPDTSLSIEHDVWIGANSIFTAGCSRVGTGAVIGAGSVVTKDVSNFAIVAGNPARLLRYRFNEPVQHKIIESQWWAKPVDYCVQHMQAMVTPLDKKHLIHPLFTKNKSELNKKGGVG